MRRLRRFLEPLRRVRLRELVGDPETLIVDSTLLSVIATQASRGLQRFRGSFLGEVEHLLGVRGKAAPHLLDQPRAHLLRAHRRQRRGRAIGARAALARAGLEEDAIARRLFADLAYRSARLKEELAEAGVVLQTERAERRPAIRQQAEVLRGAQEGLRDRRDAGYHAGGAG